MNDEPMNEPRPTCQLNRVANCKKFSNIWSCLLQIDCCVPCYEDYAAENFGAAPVVRTERETRYFHEEARRAEGSLENLT